MAREIPVTQARAELADLVSRVGYTGERILLTRHGRPLAALVPAADLEILEQPPAEVGFTFALREPPSSSREPSEDQSREAPSRSMRIAAELRRPDDPDR